jgi:hypothetical protein
MQTRSQTNLLLKKVEQKLPLLKVDIDFDEASKAWKSNKKSTGNGCYKYICTKITKTGKQCKNDSIRNCEYCRFHNKNSIQQII